MPYPNPSESTPTAHEAVSDAVLNPLGYAQDKTLTTAKALPSIPSGAKFALIQILTQNVRWRDDGTDPTAALGMQMASDKDYWYTGDLSTFKVIEETATAELNVSYYGYV